MTLSNCHLTAWKKFRNEVASSLSVQYTKNSKVQEYFSKKPIILLPLRLLGIVVQWIAWPLVHVGELLRTGRWYHVTWREGVVHKEFVPLSPRIKKWFPPILFKGKEQEIKNEL